MCYLNISCPLSDGRVIELGLPPFRNDDGVGNASGRSIYRQPLKLRTEKTRHQLSLDRIGSLARMTLLANIVRKEIRRYHKIRIGHISAAKGSKALPNLCVLDPGQRYFPWRGHFFLVKFTDGSPTSVLYFPTWIFRSLQSVEFPGHAGKLVQHGQGSVAGGLSQLHVGRIRALALGDIVVTDDWIGRALTARFT